MKLLIRNIVIKVAVTVILVAVLSLVLSAIMPTFGNDIAMGQLEHDDVSFMQMEMWNRIQNGVETAQYIIVGISGVCVGTDVYKIIMKKFTKETEKV
jgi:hypothetical protein